MYAVPVVYMLLALSSQLAAQRLPVRSYTSADGLPNDHVNNIVQDSHGYLWFCTREGLSRFDGYQSTNYGTNDGAPSSNIATILETSRGEYWMATASGLYRFDPNAPSNAHRTLYWPEDKAAWRFNSLLDDHAGGLWCGTYGGLYHFRPPRGASPPMPFEFIELNQQVEFRPVFTITEDRDHNLWVGFLQGSIPTHPRWPCQLLPIRRPEGTH